MRKYQANNLARTTILTYSSIYLTITKVAN